MCVSAGARRGPSVRALLELDSQAVTGLPRWVPQENSDPLSAALSSSQPGRLLLHGDPSFLVCVSSYFLLIE